MLNKFYKVINFVIIISIIALTLGSVFYQKYQLDKKENNTKPVIKITDKDYDKLKVKGYNKEEIKYITSNKELLKIVLTKDYNKQILILAKEKYFLVNNLERYLSYLSNNNKPLSEIISIVNVNRDKDYYTDTIATDISKKNLMLVNKYYYLKNDFNPNDLVDVTSNYGYGTNSLTKEVYDAYIKMHDEAANYGLTLIINSSYREYDTQRILWNRYKNNNGEKWADTVSARAGYSEHQTGLTLDIGTKTASLDAFEDTKEFDFVSKNAHKYGFILRYPDGLENITGYSYEPWHYRYVGVKVATKIKELNITFDEYYAYFVK